MSLGNTEKEMECVLNWFQNWSVMQKGTFLKELVDLAVQSNLDSLFDAMDTLNMQDKPPPNIFQCQIKLFTDWFQEWTDSERNAFVFNLNCIDPKFVESFNEHVNIASYNNAAYSVQQPVGNS